METRKSPKKNTNIHSDKVFRRGKEATKTRTIIESSTFKRLKNTPIECMDNNTLHLYAIRNFCVGDMTDDERSHMLGAIRSAIEWGKDHSMTYDQHDKYIRKKRADYLKKLEQKVKERMESEKPKEHIIEIDL